MLDDIPSDLPALVARYIRAALPIVQAAAALDSAPRRAAYKLERANGITRTEQTFEVDFRIIVALLGEELKGLTEFTDVLTSVLLSQRCIDELLVDAGGNPIQDEKIRADWLQDFYLAPMLVVYMNSDPTMPFTQERAEEMGVRLAQFIRAETAPYSLTTPLSKLTSELATVELDEQTRIRRLTDQELVRIFELDGGMRGIRSAYSAQLSHCIEAMENGPKNLRTDLADAEARIRCGLTALRLLKSGGVSGTDTTYRQVNEPRFGTAFGFTRGTGGHQYVPLSPAYTVLNDDIPALQDLYAKLRRPRPPTLEQALGRFQMAYERIRYEDRLVDYWIGLEALLLPDTSDELSYRASLRAAYLLGGDGDERLLLFTSLRRSYVARSKVVHGSTVVDAGEIANMTEDVLRRTLSRALEDWVSLAPSTLDDAIARGG